MKNNQRVSFSFAKRSSGCWNCLKGRNTKDLWTMAAVQERTMLSPTDSHSDNGERSKQLKDPWSASLSPTSVAVTPLPFGKTSPNKDVKPPDSSSSVATRGSLITPELLAELTQEALKADNRRRIREKHRRMIESLESAGVVKAQITSLGSKRFLIQPAPTHDDDNDTIIHLSASTDQTIASFYSSDVSVLTLEFDDDEDNDAKNGGDDENEGKMESLSAEGTVASIFRPRSYKKKQEKAK